jgi:hypothetical protein
MNNKLFLGCCLMLLIHLLLATKAYAWHAGGHTRICQAAIVRLPPDMPAFFSNTEAQETIAHLSIDPDCYKHEALPQLSQTESPEHYMDYELVTGLTLPQQRYDFLAMCYEKKLNPQKVGTLPYAITEWAQRLTMAFAEHRRWPRDLSIQVKCHVYAGILAHYVGDLVQPLHCTVHHDGRMGPDGKMEAHGIHHKVDHVIEALQLDTLVCTSDVKPLVIHDSIFTAMLEQIRLSNQQVDQVYALADRWPDRHTSPVDKPDPQVHRMAVAFLRHGAALTAGLFLRAWEDSASIHLPNWQIQERTEPTVQTIPAHVFRD